MIRLAERTWREAARLAADPRSVVLLPLGAIEQHGPHLPLLVDWLGAEELARRVAPHLRRAGFRPLLLPGLPYGASPLARGFAGTIGLSTRPRRVRRRLARRLPAHWIDVRGALDTCTTFGEMDASGRGYFGWPAAARAVTGRRALALRARLLARALLAELGAPLRKR